MRGLRQLRGLALFLSTSILTLPLWSVSPLFGQATVLSSGPTANISLSSGDTTLTQTSDSAWTLDKSGSLSGNTVTWNISATETATVPGQLVLSGQMTVVNSGSGLATIGNIVVNLQQQVNRKWVTVSSNIADVTQGDDATTATIHKAASSEGKSSFSENEVCPVSQQRPRGRGVAVDAIDSSLDFKKMVRSERIQRRCLCLWRDGMGQRHDMQSIVRDASEVWQELSSLCWHWPQRYHRAKPQRRHRRPKRPSSRAR